MPVDDTDGNIKNVTTRIKTEDGKDDSIIFIDSVTTENSNEASSIEEFSDIITNYNIFQVTKKEINDSSAASQGNTSSCREHNYAACSSIGQKLRRSPRLAKKSIQKRTEQNSNTHSQVLVTVTQEQNKVTAKKKKKTSKNSQQNCRREIQPNLLNISICPEPTTSYVARNPERVLGVTIGENEKKYIIIKWTNGTSSRVPEENLTPEMKRLLFLYYRAELFNLQIDIYPTTPIVAEESPTDMQVGITNNDDQSSESLDHISGTSCVSDSPLPVKTEMHNISEFKKRQKQYLKENPPPANTSFDDPSIDLKMD